MRAGTMRHPEFLKHKFQKRGCRERSIPAGVRGLSGIGFLAMPSPSGIAKGGEPFAGARGVPAKPLFLVLLAAGGGER